MATFLWAYFAAIGLGKIQGPLGGLLGFCGWFPFAQQLDTLLSVNASQIFPIQHEISSFFFSEIAGDGTLQITQAPDRSILSTPVFLSHGTDDVWVSVELGRQASQILHKIMAHVEWHEFTGAEGDGHWVKEPEGFDQILLFLGA
jgi:pimeloyl-ACP methyl ester carboxylesterase